MSNPKIYFSNKEIGLIGMRDNCTCETQIDFLPPIANIKYDMLKTKEFSYLEVKDDKYAIWSEYSNGISIVNKDGLEFIQNLDISKTDKETLKILYEQGLIAEK